MWTIRSGVEADLPALATIERDAFASLAAAGAAWGDAADTLDAQILRECIGEGLLFVAVGGDGAPAGFAALAQYREGLYLGEIDVTPAMQGRGIGRALMGRAIAEAAARGDLPLFLTTDRFAPFNAPFYASLGFRECAPEEAPPFLASKLAAEIGSGADPARRVAMRRGG